MLIHNKSPPFLLHKEEAIRKCVNLGNYFYKVNFSLVLLT